VFKLKKIKMPNRPAMPFPTILVGADVNGRPNYCTVGACGVVNLEPMLYVSLKETHYTTTGIKASGFFSVNLPSPDLAEKTDFCGVVSGKTTDKSELFTPFYDESGRAPMIHECPINMLCKVTQTITLSGFAMFLGEIVAVYADEKGLTDGQIDPVKINPMVMMYPSYFELGKVVGTVFKDGNDYKKSLGIWHTS
jgi:flavin reductase (DIM6/NTAB) family NADH-FMN oxidoreductase RutF